MQLKKEKTIKNYVIIKHVTSKIHNICLTAFYAQHVRDHNNY